MSDQYEFMLNIYKRAQEYPDGATQPNIFKETVHHLVVDEFYGLYKKTNNKKPAREELAECLVNTADKLFEKNKQMLAQEELENYKKWLRENAERFRPLFEKVIEEKTK